MHRNIDQHVSSEGTVYLHSFRNPSSSTHASSSNARSSTSGRNTDVTSSTSPLTPNAMDPSLSGA